MTYSFEKDHRTATVTSSDLFMGTYNHDRADEGDLASLQAAAHGPSEAALGMEDIVACSMSRQATMNHNWRMAVQRRQPQDQQEQQGKKGALLVEDVVRLVSDPVISNEETHYSVVMDPDSGRVVWRTVFLPAWDE